MALEFDSIVDVSLFGLGRKAIIRPAWPLILIKRS